MVEHAVWEARQEGLKPRDAPELMDALEWLGITYLREDQPARAESPLLDALRFYRRLSGVDHPRVKYLTANLIAAYQAQGRDVPGISRLERKLSTAGKDGPITRRVNRLRYKLFNAYWTAGRTQDAFKLFRDALRVSARAQGPECADCLVLRHQLAWQYLDAELPEGLPLLERNITALERTGCRVPTLAFRRSELAMVYLWFGRPHDAVKTARRGLDDLAGIEDKEARRVRDELLRIYANAADELAQD